MFDNALLYNRKGSYHHRYSQRVRHGMLRTYCIDQAHRQQILQYWEPRAEELLLVTLRRFNHCCGGRRLYSGMPYRCRAGTCFIQVCRVSYPATGLIGQHGTSYWLHVLEDSDGREEFIYCQVWLLAVCRFNPSICVLSPTMRKW